MIRWNDEEIKGLIYYVTIVFAIIFGAVVAWTIQSCNESQVYNRLTGASTTTWDAMWVELRVVEPLREKQNEGGQE